MSDKKLTDKEEAFCYNYVYDPETRWNGTQSAIKAGYSENTAKEISYENLTKPHIKERISELSIESREPHEELINKVIEERKRLAFSDISDFIDEDGTVKGFDGLDTRVIKEFKVTERQGTGKESVFEKRIEIKLHDKTANLNGLASFLGIDKIKTDLKVSGINIVYLDKQDEKL